LGRQPFGILIYLRQEGRGIGLRKKLEAYNLQDQGMDTVEANIHLGHQADERDYGIAGRILKDLRVASIRLITNNPHKVDELKQHGISVDSRVPIEVGHHPDNLDYLRSKAEKMAHWLTFQRQTPDHCNFDFIRPLLDQLTSAQGGSLLGRPFVTLAYAQSMDGSIASNGKGPLLLSSDPSLTLTHFLRAQHDGLLVGVNTILVDDPQLNVRHWNGTDPRVVILDSALRTPPDCRALKQAKLAPIIVTTDKAKSEARARLLEKGAILVTVGQDPEGFTNLPETLDVLRGQGLRSLMVEGGARVICGFLRDRLVDYCVVTIVPRIVGGIKAIDGFCGGGAESAMSISGCQYQVLGSDLIAYGPVGYD
jgi:3,4-dihydroxy 2-butanone 4-phosphate synthase/GTP cyclohydrolase II